MQLIRIVNVPIEYRMEIEHPTLQKSQISAEGLSSVSPKSSIKPPAKTNSHNASSQLHNKAAEALVANTATTKNIDVNHKKTDHSGGGVTSASTTHSMSSKDMSAASSYTTTPYTIPEPVTIQPVEPSTVESRTSDVQTAMASNFLSMAAASNWSPNAQNIEYEPGAITFDWNKLTSTMEYVPGTIKIEILRYPEVQIEYIGEPQYVPKSSAPNYKE